MIICHAENYMITKCFDPRQPARTAQADVSRYISQMHQATPFTQNTAHRYVALMERSMVHKKWQVV